MINISLLQQQQQKNKFKYFVLRFIARYLYFVFFFPDTTLSSTVAGNTISTTPSGATNVVCSVVAIIAGFTAALLIRP